MDAVIGLICLNGFYDIICGMCLLDVLDVPVLNTIHSSMFEIYHEPLVYRMMGYYVLTNGLIRFLFRYHNYKLLLVYTYLIEGIWCVQEGFVYKTMYPDKAFYVMFMCYTLGYICSTLKT